MTEVVVSNQENTPLVSIIIPTYNSELTLKACLESVLRQTFTDYEVLVIDGLSADGTLSIVKGFASTHSRLRRISEKDEGVYDAMNKGIKHAKGKWLYFLGSDDALFNENVLLALSSKIPTITSDFFYGDVYINGQTGWANDKTYYDGEFSLKKLLYRNICHQSVFYKRATILKHKMEFDLKYPVCADWDFNLRCWSISALQYIPLPIAIFNAGGVSSQSVIDSFPGEIVVKLVAYFGNPPISWLKKNVPASKMHQLRLLRKYSFAYFKYNVLMEFLKWTS